MRRVASPLGVAAAIALLGILAASAGAGTYGQPDRVLVATTGNDSELVTTLDITPTSDAAPAVVMSLPPGGLGNLMAGDRLRPSSELEVTTDCLSADPSCVGEPYDYNPTVRTQLVLAPDSSTTGGPTTVALSPLKQQTCLQRLPNRQHHCASVFPHQRFDVSDTSLPCPPDACYLNLVASAWSPTATPGDKLLVGASQPEGTANADKGRVNAVRLRPNAPGPTPQGQVRKYSKTTPLTQRLAVGDASSKNSTVVFSRRLGVMSAGAQLAAVGRVRTDIASLPYNVLIQSRLVLTTSRLSLRPTEAVRQSALLRGYITELNGFNCTRATTPCPTTKVGVTRLLAGVVDSSGEPAPLYVNLVIGTKALRAQPRPGDAVKVTGGSLKVVRYPATRFG